MNNQEHFILVDFLSSAILITVNNLFVEMIHQTFESLAWRDTKSLLANERKATFSS